MTGRREHLALGIIAVVGAAMIVTFLTKFPTRDLQYVWQADAFLHGRLDLDRATVDAYSTMDMTVRDGRYYWPLGPLPAILLVPFVLLLGPEVSAQSALQLALAALVAFLAYRVARRSGVAPTGSAWLTVAFCLGSVALGVLGMLGPWQLAHAVVLACLLAALVEWRGKRRPFVVGALFALAIATRVTAVAGAPFFAVLLLTERLPFSARLARLVRFGLPVVAVIAALAWFNAARFGDPFDNGYGDSVMIVGPMSQRRAEGGLFNLSNMPRNAWYYFLAPPSWRDGSLRVDPEGMSVLMLSPAFLLAFRKRRRTWEEAGAGAAFAASLAILLPFYATGFAQFGPRYLTDVLPYAYLLLADAVAERGIGWRGKALIVCSACVNLALFTAYILVY